MAAEASARQRPGYGRWARPSAQRRTKRRIPPFGPLGIFDALPSFVAVPPMDNLSTAFE
jgi:hypothetical protein